MPDNSAPNQVAMWAVLFALLGATVGSLVSTYQLTSMRSKVEAAFCIPAE